MRVRFRHSSAPPAVGAHIVSSKPPLRSTTPRGRKQASPNDVRRSIPAGVNGRGFAASLRGPVAAARYATVLASPQQAPYTQHVPPPPEPRRYPPHDSAQEKVRYPTTERRHGPFRFEHGPVKCVVADQGATAVREHSRKRDKHVSGHLHGEPPGGYSRIQRSPCLTTHAVIFHLVPAHQVAARPVTKLAFALGGKAHRVVMSGLVTGHEQGVGAIPRVWLSGHPEVPALCKFLYRISSPLQAKATVPPANPRTTTLATLPRQGSSAQRPSARTTFGGNPHRRGAAGTKSPSPPPLATAIPVERASVAPAK
jgi:hypothetical protein